MGEPTKEIKLHKMLVTGVYGIYVDGVLTSELVTTAVPMTPGKRLTFEALDTAMQARLTDKDIDATLAQPIL